MGSSTTAEAAILRGHHYLGFEIDVNICAMANDRLRSVDVPLPAFSDESHKLVRLRLGQ